ncbi:MAG TPA: hypothetical protein VLA33_11140 [Gemmatimonadota bacterium]|nr:hypothetical protein [Gemmatimonadota bacterium]
MHREREPPGRADERRGALADSLGLVADGQFADLVLLRENPRLGIETLPWWTL